MLSARTIAVAVASAVALAVAAAHGQLSLDALTRVDHSRGLVVGILAAAGTLFVARSWRWWERGCVTAAILAIALVGVSDAGVARLADIPNRLAEVSLTRYCDERPALAAPSATQPRHREERGCALIRRAFELGYAEDLGPCTPSKTEVPLPTRRRACQLRHRDEPFVHYAWRVFTDRLRDVSDTQPIERAKSDLREFEVQLGYLEPLVAARLDSLANTPKASHHVFVNLPAPGDRALMGDGCADRLSPDLGPNSSPSRAFETIVYQLLFDPRFGPSPASCQDYTIHWSASADACDQLAARPREYLESLGAYDRVVAVLDRYRATSELWELDRTLGRDRHPRPPRADQVVSLSCLVLGDGDEPRAPANRRLRLSGFEIDARSVRVARLDSRGSGLIGGYRAVASLLASGAYLGSGEPRERVPTIDELIGSPFLLSNLEHLRRADPFAGSAAILDEDSVRSVYPLVDHLVGFIEPFRLRHNAARRRL